MPEALASVSPAATTPEQSEALYAKLSPGPGKPASKVSAHQRARIHSAMVKLVAKQGYEDVTVRGIARLAKVSSRAFYNHFEGKEDCFLRTYDLIVQRTARRIVASQAGERDWQERLRLAFGAFVRELEREPQAGYLALVEAYAAGPKALEHIRRAECIFEGMLRDSFARSPNGIEIPPMIVAGMIAGAISATRTRLLAGDDEDLPALGDSLTSWVLSYYSEVVVELAALDQRAASASTAEPTPMAIEQWGNQIPADDRTLIFTAIAKLAVTEGYSGLTLQQILAATGVPKRSFTAHFSSVADCFLEALRPRIDDAIAKAARAQTGADTWERGLCQAIVSLCGQITQDPLLAKLCFVDVFALGEKGLAFREDLIADLAFFIGEAMPPSERPEGVVIEAAVGAAWGVIQHLVISDRVSQVPRIAATLAYLVLAPSVGSMAAITAISGEQIAR